VGAHVGLNMQRLIFLFLFISLPLLIQCIGFLQFGIIADSFTASVIKGSELIVTEGTTNAAIESIKLKGLDAPASWYRHTIDFLAHFPGSMILLAIYGLISGLNIGLLAYFPVTLLGVSLTSYLFVTRRYASVSCLSRKHALILLVLISSLVNMFMHPLFLHLCGLQYHAINNLLYLLSLYILLERGTLPKDKILLVLLIVSQISVHYRTPVMIVIGLLSYVVICSLVKQKSGKTRLSLQIGLLTITLIFLNEFCLRLLPTIKPSAVIDYLSCLLFGTNKLQGDDPMALYPYAFILAVSRRIHMSLTIIVTFLAIIFAMLLPKDIKKKESLDLSFTIYATADVGIFIVYWVFYGFMNLLLLYAWLTYISLSAFLLSLPNYIVLNHKRRMLASFIRASLIILFIASTSYLVFSTFTLHNRLFHGAVNIVSAKEVVGAQDFLQHGDSTLKVYASHRVTSYIYETLRVESKITPLPLPFMKVHSKSMWSSKGELLLITNFDLGHGLYSDVVGPYFEPSKVTSLFTKLCLNANLMFNNGKAYLFSSDGG